MANFDFSTPITKNTVLKPVFRCHPDGAIVFTQIGGSGNVAIKNKWNGPIDVNGTTVTSGNTINIACTSGEGKNIIINGDQSVLTQWLDNSSYLCSTNDDLQIEMTWVDMDIMCPDHIAPQRFMAYAFSHSKGVSLAPYCMDFSSLTQVGDEFCSSMFSFFAGNTLIPSNLFNFSNLEVADNSFLYNMFYFASGTIDIESNNFMFPSLKAVGSSAFFEMFQSASGITHLPPHSFQFPNLLKFGNNFAYSMFRRGTTSHPYPGLTALPIGFFSFNENVSTAATEMMGFFVYGNTKLSIPGNSQVAIRAVVPIKSYNGSTTIPAGSYLYVNGE